MNFDGYQMQVLVTIGKACRPNSRHPDRAWTRVEPIFGIPVFGDTLSELVRAGLLQMKRGYHAKPSPAGYDLIRQWRVYRVELKRRPVLYGRCIWDQPMELQLSQAA